MPTQRFTVRVPSSLSQRLRVCAQLRGQSESEVIREALEHHLQKKLKGVSAHDVFRAAGLIGCAKGAPKDLSTNKKYFKGFGESK
ncbi:MAG TPA: ribbon-helix-helix domain-containing protein [Candidatus Acidoferrales bacterium]|jgi:predicted transcriptional regulator|nr:ribbon-helix-helix domain-containing protein [Candidatus Acidoferrales bacterium]